MSTIDDAIRAAVAEDDAHVGLDVVQCDACGEMKPRDEIAKVTAYGIETSACVKCRGDK